MPVSPTDGCDGYRPADQGWERDDRPVIYVSWDDAQAVCNLARRDDRQDLPVAQRGGVGIRCPRWHRDGIRAASAGRQR